MTELIKQYQVRRVPFPYDLLKLLSLCLIWSSVLIQFIACSAPHDNPYDPLNPDYEPVDTDEDSALVVVSAHSINYASYGPLPTYALDIQAVIIDSIGVDHVWARLDTLELGTLYAGNNNQTWFRRFEEAQLPCRGMGDLIGHPMTLYYLDDNGRASDGIEFSLYRVIYDVPQAQFPVNDSLLTTTQPRLEWYPYGADYFFSYTVEILHIAEGSTEGTSVYRFSKIPLDSSAHSVSDPLTTQPGFFVWTVTVVDEFGNEARSLTARFRITDNG